MTRLPIVTRRWPHGLAAALAGCALGLPAFAAESDIERVRATTARLIGQLVEQGLLTRDRAQALLKELDGSATPASTTTPLAPAPAAAAATATASPAAASNPVRVPYVPEFVRQQMKTEIRDELAAQAAREGWAGEGAVPAWVRGLRVEGDLRTRLQADNYDPGNAAAISVTETNRTRALTLANTTVDRQRLRVRARLGVSFNADAAWSGSVRLTTGSSSDPLSSNQTLGTYGNRFTTTFDRAFIRWRGGADANLVLGRFGNPWYGTDLVWANDLSFDGVAAQWTPAVSTWGKAFVTAALMPVQEIELGSGDKWLYGLQAGLAWPGSTRWSARFGLGYYHYAKISGQANSAGSSLKDSTAPAFAQKGNTYFNISSDAARPLLALAPEYRLVNLTGSFDLLSFGDKHLVLTADLVRNIGYDRAEVSARLGTDVAPETSGLLLRASLGDAEVDAAGKWQAFLSYKRLERDAVPDAFTDSDLRGGGTDVKGFVLGGSYGLARNSVMSLRWLSADALTGAPLSLDTVQLDLLLRF